MNHLHSLAALVLLAAPTILPATRDERAAARSVAPGDTFEFGPREAEHLLSRAGFGGRTLEVEELVRLGLDGAVASFFRPQRVVDPFFVEHDTTFSEVRRRNTDEMAEMDSEQRRDEIRRMRNDYRRTDRRQMADYADWWVERMLDGDDPLRDRMTLFWAGLFTSSYQEVKSSIAMIEQHRLLRDGALGSYADLLRGIARDPAMLEYLDAASNKKVSPNENFARELLELFSLGEGHYAEADIVAAARAFTGWTDRNGEFRFARGQHDRGEKTFMGVTGKLDGSDVIEIILDQPRCADYVALRLLRWFEGREPSAERVAEYGKCLREADYEVRPLLEKLFTDPRFYADDVVGQRIAGPIDFLVGHARRLGVEPPARLLTLGSTTLGQTLFGPPSVKGWDGDRAWINTTTFMQRGNLAGVLVGTIGSREFMSEAATAAMEDAGAPPEMVEQRRKRRDELTRFVGQIEDVGWRPSINLSARAARAGASSDAEVVDALAQDLLAVPLAPDSRDELVAFLREERTAKSLPEDAWGTSDSDLEALARRLAHLMLSLPEAQLQ
ncbi:MAG: DUF1800 domain-containing protein [Planctomycetota bacterium]